MGDECSRWHILLAACLGAALWQVSNASSGRQAAAVQAHSPKRRRTASRQAARRSSKSACTVLTIAPVRLQSGRYGWQAQHRCCGCPARLQVALLVAKGRRQASGGGGGEEPHCRFLAGAAQLLCLRSFEAQRAGRRRFTCMRAR